MNLSSLFRAVPEMTVDELRQHMSGHAPDRYTLLDVRQPDEYEASHIPGAVLIPVGELPARVDELDPDKPVFVYCRSGARGGNGTSVLLGAGFRDARNVTGGIMAYDGLVATGAPRAGMAYFDAAREPLDYVVLAWVLEQNAQVFYTDVAATFEDPGIAKLFEMLGRGEAYHKALLADCYGRATGQVEPDVQGVVAADDQGMMEGGVPVGEAIAWARGREALDVVEYMMAMEANAYDRYLKLDRELGDPQIHQVFTALAEEEKTHLDRLAEAFENLRG